jgi:phage terminase small subunit
MINDCSDHSDRVKPTIAAQPISAQPIAAQPIDAQPNAGLDAIGSAVYQRITNLYAASGRLTALDQTILCLYAFAYSAWRRVEQSLREDGEVLWLGVRIHIAGSATRSPSPLLTFVWRPRPHALSIATVTPLVYRQRQGSNEGYGRRERKTYIFRPLKLRR